MDRDWISPGVLVRDFVIFYAKVVVDGLKDIALLQLTLLAFAVDLGLMLLTGRRRTRLFYKVMEVGERFDLWLNLHGASRNAGRDPDGLFGQSRAGDDTLLGEIEALARRGPEPTPAVRAARPLR
ncbi:MAG TPA: hypothetical protein VHG91_09640 [Longimicrobium sp.]|nr:hypothetical protein [Longimicrobium sp.]